MRPFFLVDCNNFFVSCERVFNPKLLNKPVVVLSSNDACVIARSPEAKKLGIPMGAAAWRYESFFARHNVIQYSANFALYGDMSARVMNTLTSLSPDIEYYSIDEAFLRPPACAFYAEFGKQLYEAVLQHTGIPTSIGIGPTKTLAKLANYLAKKRAEYRGIADLASHPISDELLSTIPVEEIWGIGYRYAKKLHQKKIMSARDFIKLDERWVLKNMSITGLTTLRELRGQPCLSLASSEQEKQTITVSRLFGHKTMNHEHMHQAVASYTATAAEKLRAQSSLAYGITVFVVAASYHEQHTSYKTAYQELPHPTAYTPTLIAAAHTCLRKLLTQELSYKKVGVMLSQIVTDDGIQLSTYAPHPSAQRETRIMKTIDTINKKMGKRTVHFAATGIKQPWKMRQLKKSACFTTNWYELLTITI